jgi:nicotinamidase-related amidase
MPRLIVAFLAATVLFPTIAPDSPPSLELHLRSRVQPFKGDPLWQEVSLTQTVDPAKTAIVICDMWDDHWCKSAATRCTALAHKAAPVIAAARAAGVTIIHAPSECMPFYADSPARKRAQAVPKAALPKPLDLPDPTLPCDASDGGCDDPQPVKQHKAWTRQHEAIRIDEARDYISDNGDEVYSILKERGITTLLVMGVHTNMCVLHRSFAIKNMTRRGVRCVLIRDLTDAMYNPAMKPNVSHEAGTALIIEHIEKYWCPTILSDDLLPRK